jgi:hypothetical protein
MAVDDLGIDRTPSPSTDDLGITRDPSASARPYAAPDQNAPRVQEFSTGQQGETDPARTASIRNQDPGLNLNSQQFNAQVPTRVRPTSVLQPLAKNPGGNAMSAGDAARRTVDGTYLGSVNATSLSSFEPSAMLKLATGQDSI